MDKSTTTKTIEVAQVMQLRDHHLREAKRCEEAIALFREVGRMVARAEVITGKVRERAANNGRSKYSEKEVAASRAAIIKFLHKHPGTGASEIGAAIGLTRDRTRDTIATMPEVERLGKLATSRYRLKSSPKVKASKRSKRRRGDRRANARQRIAAANGTRPIDVVRRLMADHTDTPIDRAELLERSGLIGTSQGGPPNLDATGRAKRMLGLTLSHLIKGREIRKSGDGFVAWHLSAVPAANGSATEHA